MRQAQLVFAATSHTPEKTAAASSDEPTPGLFPPVAFPRAAPAKDEHDKQAAEASGANSGTSSRADTPAPGRDEVSSPLKATPALDHSASSPASSRGPQSSPLAARAAEGAPDLTDSQASAKTATSKPQARPTLEDCGFEIVIPAAPTRTAESSSMAASTAKATAAQETETIHRPKVTKKKKLTPEEQAEREKKQQEAQAKREQKELEQKAKQESKEEQQRQREEAREAKENELRQKKEAREARDEEQRAKREAKDAQKHEKEERARKAAATAAKTRNFMSSFLKKPADGSASKQAAMAAMASARANAGKSDFQRTFLPGIYKDLAPINKWARPASSDLLRVVDALNADAESENPSPSREELLADLKTKMTPKSRGEPVTASFLSKFSSMPAAGSQGATWKPSRRGVHPPVVVRQVMRAVAESDIIGGEAATEAKRALDRIISDRNLVRLKFINFEQDRRPGWYGTFTRPSNLIGPRTPFAQDPVLLDYSYDSDDEWEDQGQLEGEDIDEGQDAEEEEKEDDDDDSEMDDWLVDDLEEVDDVEGQSATGEVAVAAKGDDDVNSDIMEVDAEGNAVPAQKPSSKAPAKRAAEETDTVVIQRGGKQKRVKALGRRFNAKLVPFSAGPHWETVAGRIDAVLFQPFQVEFLNSAHYGLNPFTFECSTVAEMASQQDTIVMAPHQSSTAPLTTKVTTPPKPLKSAHPSKQIAGAGQGTLAELFAIANAQDDPLAPPGLPPFPCAATAGEGGEKRGRSKGVFPDELLPDLLRLVDGSTRSKPALLEDLKDKFAEQQGGGGGSGGGASVNVSKTAIEKKLNEVATKEGKGKGAKWVVKGEFRSQYGLPPLTTPGR